MYLKKKQNRYKFKNYSVKYGTIIPHKFVTNVTKLVKTKAFLYND